VFTVPWTTVEVDNIVGFVSAAKQKRTPERIRNDTFIATPTKRCQTSAATMKSEDSVRGIILGPHNFPYLIKV